MTHANSKVPVRTAPSEWSPDYPTTNYALFYDTIDYEWVRYQHQMDNEPVCELDELL